MQPLEMAWIGAENISNVHNPDLLFYQTRIYSNNKGRELHTAKLVIDLVQESQLSSCVSVANLLTELVTKIGPKIPHFPFMAKPGKFLFVPIRADS